MTLSRLAPTRLQALPLLKRGWIPPVVAFVAGALALAFPGPAALAAVLAIGVYALGDGLVNLTDEFSGTGTEDRFRRSITSLVLSVLGAAILVWRDEAQVVAVVVLGIALAVDGVWLVLSALALRPFDGVAWPGGLVVGVGLMVVGGLLVGRPVGARVPVTMALGAGAVLWSVSAAVSAMRSGRPDLARQRRGRAL